jgi:hypothetical protein
MAESGPLSGLQQWHALLLAERARRTAKAEWQTNEADRSREQFLDTLQQIAQRFAAAAPRHPLDVSDMSIAEMLAVRWFLPEDLWPADLPTDDQIWAEYRSRRPDATGTEEGEVGRGFGER